MLDAVKKALGITTNYQDDTLQQYINEVVQFLIEAGISKTIVNSPEAYGVIIRGVSDLWNYGSGGASLSPYFYQRAIQLKYKSSDYNPENGTKDYNDLLNKPKIEGVTLVNNKSLNDLGVKKLTNKEIENIIERDD